MPPTTIHAPNAKGDAPLCRWMPRATLADDGETVTCGACLKELGIKTVTVKVIDVTKPIEKGSIIMIAKDALTPGMAGPLMAELREIAGHDRFIIMECPEDGAIGLIGPEDLTAALRRLAKEGTT